MKNKLLIVAPYQFGELSDCYYWAKYMALEGWSVTYLGYSYRQRDIKARICPGVRVVKVVHSKKRLIHGIKFLAAIIKEIIIHNHKNVIVCRFPKCEILPMLFPNRNIVLDVRTLSVSTNEEVRRLADNHLRRIIGYFRKTSVISRGVGEKLKGNFPILPLGAESLSMTEKDFSALRLFYIGTFNNRNLSQFIEGLSLYQKQSGDDVVTFDIVGGGTGEEEHLIRETIIKTGVRGVYLHGSMTHEEAKKFFDKCNVGVCYIPKKDYYEYQPPTKLYEYLLSGMACIATDTHSNKEVLNFMNGILVEDNADSVSKGLVTLRNNMQNYSSEDIRTFSQKFHWRTIINNSLIPILNL